MDSFKSYLLGSKNISMLENIIIDKLYDTTGISLNKKDSFFQKSMNLVITTVVNNELQHLSNFDQKTVLKMNNIFIKETVRYLQDILTDEQEFTSKLSEEDEIEQLEETVQEPLKPKIIENIYYFDETTTFLNIENVVAMELINFTIDYSGYIVNKSNCNLCIDNVEYQIENGNYTPEELIDYLNLLSEEVVFTLNRKKDIIVMSVNRPQERKSLTGSIKDKEVQKQVNVNFGVKNSIAKLLGYQEKTYIVKDQINAEMKHLIKHPSFIDISVKYSETSKEDHRVFMNTGYNETVHYTPIVSKKVTTLPILLKNIVLETDYDSNRPFCFSIKISTMLENI